MKLTKTLTSKPVLLLSAAIVLNIILAVYFFGTFDVKAWIRAAGLANQFGPLRSYSIYNMFYPPLSTVVLWAVGFISNIKPAANWLTEYPAVAEIAGAYIPIKLSILFFLCLTTSICIFVKAKLNNNFSWGIVSTAVLTTLLNPAIILNTSVLGYTDIFIAPPLIASLYLFKKKFYLLSGVLLAISFSIKLLPIFLIPAFIAYFSRLNTKNLVLRLDLKKIFSFVSGILLVAVPLILIFNYHIVFNIIKVSSLHGNELSLDALNLNYLIRLYLYPDNQTPAIWMLVSKGLFSAFLLTYLIKIAVSRAKNIQLLIAASVGIMFSYFIFFTGAHENHLFPAVILAIFLYVFSSNKNNLSTMINFSMIMFSNLLIFYWFGHILRSGELIQTAPQIIGPFLPYATTALCLYSLFYFARYTYNFLTRLPNSQAVEE